MEHQVSGHSVSRNTLYLTSAYVLQKILTLVYNVMIARVYLPANQGRYNTALAFTALFSVIIDLGLASVLTREVARDREHASKYFSQILMLRVVLGVVVYGAMIVMAHLYQYPATTIQMIYILGIATLFDVICTSCWAVWRGFHNLRYEAQGAILVTSIMVVLGGTAMYLHWPIISLAYALLVSSSVGLAYGLFFVIRRSGIQIVLKPDLKLLRTLLALSIPFALAAIFSRIYTFIDVVLLAKMAGDEFAGWYSIANKIILALQFLPAAVAASIYPAMSGYHTKSGGVALISQTFFRAMRYLLLMVVPMAAGLVLLAEQIIVTFLGSAYLPAIPLLYVLSSALIFAFLIFPLGSLIAAVNRQSINTATLCVAAAVNVLANVLLIPEYQALGAAIASVLTYGFIFVVEMIIMRQYWQKLTGQFVVVLAKIVLATAVMSGVLLLMRDVVHVIISVVVGVLAYGLVAYGTKLVTWQEVKAILKGPAPISEPTTQPRQSL